MLRNLSKTRWSARVESIQAVWTSFEVILDVLYTITNKSDVKTKTQALGLKKKMLSLDFVVALMFIKNIAYKTKSLVVQLQSVELNILVATGLVHGTLSILQKLCDDDKMIDNQIEASIIFARNIEINAEADFNRHHRPRKAPRRVDEQAETATVFSLRAYCRNQFREVLDVLTSRMIHNERTFGATPEESFAFVEMFEATNWWIWNSFCSFIISTFTITWPISYRTRTTSFSGVITFWYW